MILQIAAFQEINKSENDRANYNESLWTSLLCCLENII